MDGMRTPVVPIPMGNVNKSRRDAKNGRDIIKRSESKWGIMLTGCRDCFLSFFSGCFGVEALQNSETRFGIVTQLFVWRLLMIMCFFLKIARLINVHILIVQKPPTIIHHSFRIPKQNSRKFQGLRFIIDKLVPRTHSNADKTEW